MMQDRETIISKHFLLTDSGIIRISDIVSVSKKEQTVSCWFPYSIQICLRNHVGCTYKYETEEERNKQYETILTALAKSLN